MNRIKQLREKDNLTLSELGQKVDLPKGTLSRHENGVRDPKPAMWVRRTKKDECKRIFAISQ